MAATDAQRREFADALKNARRDAQITQEEIAAQLAVSRAAVSEWEHAKSAPKTRDLAERLDQLLIADGRLVESLGFAGSSDRVADFMAALEASVAARHEERLELLEQLRERLREENLQTVSLHRWELDPDIDWLEVLAIAPEHVRRGIIEILDPYVDQWLSQYRERRTVLRAAKTNEPADPGPKRQRPSTEVPE